MTKEQVFASWAPPESIWSPWVKPVLFAHADLAPVRGDPASFSGDSSWFPKADENTAVAIDLPGATSVAIGIALGRIGFRPVPLFNAAPGPVPELRPGRAVALVEVWDIVDALVSASPALSELNLPPAAPPAFLLDADRGRGRGIFEPGRFDNRSVSFPTDFPSPDLLLHHGIHRVLLVQDRGTQPQPDLAHTLRRWQDSGIAIEVKELAEKKSPEPIVVKQPSLYRWVWHRLSMLAGLRRNPLGGFDGMLSGTAGSGP